MSRRLIMTGRGSAAGRGGGEVIARQAALDHGAGRAEVEGAVGADGSRLRAPARIEELVLLMPPRELQPDEVPGELVELGALDRLEPGRANVALEVTRDLRVEVVLVGGGHLEEPATRQLSQVGQHGLVVRRLEPR